MQHFLLVFDRAKGEVLRNDAFDDVNEALVERFRVEKLHRANPDIEVVVLSAASREALLTTHARYFLTLSQLVDRFQQAL